MRDRDGWLHTTMIELAAGPGEFDESVYVRGFADRLTELLSPAWTCVLLLADNGEAALLSEEGGGAHEGPSQTASVVPMRRSEETIGLVRVLAPPGHMIPAADLRLARTLAELAAITIVHQRELGQSQRLARQLQHALDSRIIIEQAKGALSAWLGITPGDAFGLLRSYARAHSRTLPQAADDVVCGTVPASALLARGARGGNRAGNQARSGNQGAGGNQAAAANPRESKAVRSGLAPPSAAPPRPRCRPAECRSPRT